MNRVTIDKLYLLISFVIVSLNSHGGIIRGQEIDAATGQPVMGATLIIEKTKLYNASGLGGFYQIKNVLAGTYKICISYVSYRTMGRDVTIESANQVVPIYLRQWSETKAHNFPDAIALLVIASGKRVFKRV